jgi:plastocyanin
MSRRLLVLMSAVALVAAACGSSSKDAGSTTTTSTTAASTVGITVEVDGKAPDFNAGFLAYFPHEVQAHPGDTVTFHNNFSGEPHTVTLGTDVDAAVAAAATADPNGDPPAAVLALPSLLPQGPGDANQTAAKECVVTSGALPKNGEGCTAATAPFNGKQVFYNSGYLPPDTNNWKLKLASDIAPGKYNFYCLLHGPAMSGTLEVVPAATTVPTAASVAAKAANERDTQLAKVKDTVKALATGTVPALSSFVPTKADQVWAGGAIDDPDSPQIENFGPQQIKIPVGGSVTWVILGPHTITFNAPKDASTVLVKGDDGGYHINEKAAGPAGGPPVDVPSGAANGPPPAPKVTDGGSFDGSGFRSSGLAVSFPPALAAYKLTFTKAGTFGYVCLVHPGMTGSVQVG